ncbi:MAG: transcriptional regulator [Pseudomonadota bacterium]|nr:transcriptional regulator [Pseudomonadota bacterium]
MALTREFCETVRERAQVDPEFRVALLTEAAEAVVTGDADTARALLRDYINATLGFEALAKETGISAKSLHRMFGPKGNPTLSNLTTVLRVLEANEGLTFVVSAEC